MASQWLKARQTKYGAYAAVYILVVIAIVVVANMLANRYNKSYDTTSNKRYSLSDQTKKIVNGLKQDATITYFNQSTRFQEGKDLLDEYANLSPKVHVEYVDPDKNPQLARAAGIREFGTAVVQIGDKKETAKSMTEEGITGAFIRDLKGTTRTVCFVTGSGEHQIDDTERDGFSHFKDLLAKDEYRVQGDRSAAKGRGAGRLHRAGGRRPHARLPAAGSGRDQELCRKWRPGILHARSAGSVRTSRRLPTTMR